MNFCHKCQWFSADFLGFPMEINGDYDYMCEYPVWLLPLALQGVSGEVHAIGAYERNCPTFEERKPK